MDYATLNNSALKELKHNEYINKFIFAKLKTDAKDKKL